MPNEDVRAELERLRLENSILKAGLEANQVNHESLIKHNNKLAEDVRRLSAWVGVALAAINDLPNRIVQDVSELPDYTSPEDVPDLLQCTVQELTDILMHRTTEIIHYAYTATQTPPESRQ